MGKLKKIGIGLGIGIGGFFIILIAISVYTFSQAENTVNVPNGVKFTPKVDMVGKDKIQQSSVNISNNELVPKLYMKPTNSLILTRTDLGTIWRIISHGTNIFDEDTYGVGLIPDQTYLNELKSGLKNNGGYKEGTVQTYKKNEEYTKSVFRIWVFQFDTPNNALKYYDDRITTLIEDGGFHEYNVGMINAKCYGTSQMGTFYESLNVYCVKENIFYHVDAADSPSFTSEDKDAVKNFAEIITNKINHNLG